MKKLSLQAEKGNKENRMERKRERERENTQKITVTIHLLGLNAQFTV